MSSIQSYWKPHWVNQHKPKLNGSYIKTTSKTCQELKAKKEKKLQTLYQEQTLWIQPKEHKANITATLPCSSDLNSKPESQDEHAEVNENVDKTVELRIINSADHKLSEP